MTKKKTKLSTSVWILKGYGSEEAYNMQKSKSSTSSKQSDDSSTKAKGISKKKKNEKTFKIRKCPKCGSDDVSVVVGKEKTREWECHKCKWEGKDINEIEMSEENFMKYLDEKGEKVS